MFKKFTITFAFCAIVLGAQTQYTNAQTIVDIASGDSNFSNLVDAVVSQDLVDTLNSDGPFTVFAPTNDAFSELPSYVGEALAADPSLLTDILLYHVVSGELIAADVLDTKNIETVGGEDLRVNLIDGAPFVNSSAITAVDIDADNGVVHVIDRVLLPKSVYRAVLENLRHELAEIRDMMHDVRNDSRTEKYTS